MVFVVLPSGPGPIFFIGARKMTRIELANIASATELVSVVALLTRVSPPGPGIRADQPRPSARLVARTRSADPSRTSLN